MTTRTILYYGFAKDSYLECTNFIRSTNRKHITILSVWFFLINLFYLIFSYLNLFGVNEERMPFYFIFSFIGLSFVIWTLFFPHAVEKHIYLAVFSSIISLLTYGVISSVMEPYMPATMFPLLLVLVSLSFIGNMGIMLLFSAIGITIFLLTSYEFKTFSIAYRDTYNAFIVITLSIGLHYTFQRTRVSQFILYQKDLQIQKELEIKSSFDTLTGLLNRERFFSITDQILRTQKGYSALCLLDLDGFKQINDNLGHQMGDKVIQTVGNTIIKTFKIPDRDKRNISTWGLSESYPIAGRLGGDEFIMMIHTKANGSEVHNLLKELLQTLNSVRFDQVDGIHASIGITEIIPGEKDIDNAYKRADEALYASKRAGKNQIHFSSETLPGDA